MTPDDGQNKSDYSSRSTEDLILNAQCVRNHALIDRKKLFLIKAIQKKLSQLVSFLFKNLEACTNGFQVQLYKSSPFQSHFLSLGKILYVLKVLKNFVETFP